MRQHELETVTGEIWGECSDQFTDGPRDSRGGKNTFILLPDVLFSADHQQVVNVGRMLGVVLGQSILFLAA